MKKFIVYLVSLFMLCRGIPISAEEQKMQGFSLFEVGSETYTEIDEYGEKWVITITALQPLDKTANLNSKISAGTYKITGSSTYASMNFKITVNNSQGIIRAFDNSVTAHSGFSVTSNYLTHSPSIVNHHACVSNIVASYNYVLTCYIENGQLYHYVH